MSLTFLYITKDSSPLGNSSGSVLIVSVIALLATGRWFLEAWGQTQIAKKGELAWYRNN